MADSKPNVLITGIAGFIGFHLANRLVADGFQVYGVDNLNNYYSVDLKRDRLKALGISGDLPENQWLSNTDNSIRYKRMDLTDAEKTTALLSETKFETVVHLAAQPGVRLSISRPDLYFNANLVATYNLLEAAKEQKGIHLIIGSSSSVYGKQEKTPYSEDDKTDFPVSLYAATKKCVEVFAHYYSTQYQIKTTLLRFFTVYGPWGRPDMAVYGFFSKVLNDEPISLYNNGNLMRDFTYIDDIVLNISMLAQQNNSSKEQLYSIYNLGNESPTQLLEFVETIERITGKQAHKTYLPMQDGDVFQTYADSSKIKKEFNHEFHTPLETGLKKFYDWYIAYHQPVSEIKK